jgi:hypothetical protein
MSDIMNELNSASKQLNGSLHQQPDKDVFGKKTELTFRKKLKETAQDLALNSKVRLFMLKIYKAKIFNRGNQFNKLNKTQKKGLARDIVLLTKESREIKGELNKSPTKFEKEISILNKAVKMLRNMHKGTKMYLRDELEEQYENDKIFKSHMLHGLGVSHLAEIFYENSKRIEKNIEPIPSKKIFNLSKVKLGKTYEISMAKNKAMEMDHSMKMNFNPYDS